jgi:hypothetical protein
MVGQQQRLMNVCCHATVTYAAHVLRCNVAVLRSIGYAGSHSMRPGWMSVGILATGLV